MLVSPRCCQHRVTHFLGIESAFEDTLIGRPSAQECRKVQVAIDVIRGDVQTLTRVTNPLSQKTVFLVDRLPALVKEK